MASSMYSFLSSISLLPLFLFLFYPRIQGEGHGSYHTVDLTRTAPSAINCSSSNSGAGKISLGLYHRYGPCARPLQDYSRPSLQQVRMHDKFRIQALLREGSEAGRSVVGRAALELPNRMFGADDIYVVEIGLGTPMVKLLVNFDTGSDLTWVQCSPCLRCLSQADPIFAPASSTTYKSASCTAAGPCTLLDESTHNGCSTAGTCAYKISYGDNATSTGELATDALTFATAAGGSSIPGFVFGCGTNQSGSYGGASGMLGLSRSPVSIVNQTLSYFAGVFSYCLPASPQTTGHLTFGASVGIPYQYVPMLISSRLDIYYINLIGISLGGTRLPIQEADFQTQGGTIIDSGTTLTSIPPPAYKTFRDTFVAQVSNLNAGVNPVITQDGIACYRSTDLSQMTIPQIALHFSGVAVQLSPSGIFIQVEGGMSCLAFEANGTPNKDPNIIGYVNQRQLEVVYDILNSRIGFAKGTCV